MGIMKTHRGDDNAPDRRAGLLEEAGFHVLHDQWAEVRPGLIISGRLTDLTSRRRGDLPYAGFVDRALAGRPAGATVFVSHSPWLGERVAKHGARLMLSGHTHNGQIWPFTYYVGRRYSLMAGRYDVKGMPVIVCRGYGNLGTAYALMATERDLAHNPPITPKAGQSPFPHAWRRAWPPVPETARHSSVALQAAACFRPT